MGGLMAGLQIALSGLNAQQAVMSVASNNIANAGNANYATEEAVLAPNPPYSPPALDQPNVPGQYGQGVSVASVSRQVSQFLQLQGWANDGQLGAANEQAQALGQAQALMDEPSSDGLNNALSQFWSAWQSLASDPGSSAAQTQVVSAGQGLAQTFQSISQGLTSLQSNLDSSVSGMVSQINTLAGEIASYNQEIGASTTAGQQPNDLEDQRDALIGQLAQYVPVDVSWASDGEVTVQTGGVNLVQDSVTTSLQATPDPANHNFEALSWPDGLTADINGGELGALVTMRDQTIPGYLDQLNAIASGVATAVNAQEAQGSTAAGTAVSGTGLADFFTVPTGGVTAANIAVNPSLVSAPAGLAVGAVPSGGSGDGTNALAIANLADQATVGTATASDAYAALIGQVGSDVATAQAAQSQQQSLQQSISNQQQQVSGVSLNQDMVTVVQAQNAFASAAQVTSAIDQMLGDLVNMVQV